MIFRLCCSILEFLGLKKPTEETDWWDGPA